MPQEVKHSKYPKGHYGIGETMYYDTISGIDKLADKNHDKLKKNMKKGY